MGQVDLPPKAQEAVDILKRKVQSVPILVFPDFDKPFLLKTDASKEGLGAVLSRKQGDGCYHPVTFSSHSLTMSEKNYHMPAYVIEVRRCFKEAYAEAHLQTNCKAEKQKRYYNRTMSTTQLVLGNVVLMKNDAYQGKQSQGLVE